MSEYQAGKDAQNLLERMERLEKVAAPKLDELPIVTLNLSQKPDENGELTGYVNGKEQKMKVSLEENENFTCNWIYAGHFTDFVFHIHGVEGSGPAAGFVSEWNPLTGEPMIGNAIFYLHSTNRAPGVIRLVVTSSYGNPLHCGVGYIACK